MRFRIEMLPRAVPLFVIGMAINQLIGADTLASRRQLQRIEAPEFDQVQPLDRGVERLRKALALPRQLRIGPLPCAC